MEGAEVGDDVNGLEDMERQLMRESERLEAIERTQDNSGASGEIDDVAGEEGVELDPLELSKPSVVFDMEESFQDTREGDEGHGSGDVEGGSHNVGDTEDQSGAAEDEGGPDESLAVSMQDVAVQNAESEGQDPVPVQTMDTGDAAGKRASQQLASGGTPTARSHASSVRSTSSEAARQAARLEEEAWVQEDKHIIVLSDAGKPIYTQHGSEDMIVTRAGVVQALISFVEENYRMPEGEEDDAQERGQRRRRVIPKEYRDELTWFKAGEFNFVFLVRSPLYLVMISKTHEAVKHLQSQLQYVYNQLLSITTLSHIERAFQRWSNYDLRRHLTGAEKFTRHLIVRMRTDYSFFLDSFQCLPMEPAVRDKLGSLLQTHRSKEVVFALVVGRGKVMSLMRPRRFPLEPQDILLMLNVVQTPTRSFDVGESWIPLCLPHFNSSGFMHAHVSFLHEEAGLYLMLLSNKQDAANTLSVCRNKFHEGLQRTRLMSSLLKAARAESFRVSSLRIPDLRHFVYKHIKTNQFASPILEPPYSDPEEERRLFCLYQRVESQMHAKHRPVKLFFRSSLQESVLGWATATFELYAVFDALATKQAITQSVLDLLRWLKKSESRLFMLSPQLT